MTAMCHVLWGLGTHLRDTGDIKGCGKAWSISVKGRTMAKSTMMLLSAILLFPFLLSNTSADEDPVEYEPGIKKFIIFVVLNLLR